ncbi:MAG: exodeoxyribonuclease I [Gammaproteobacteria bacterium]|nr:MAG: exodeoxyribonuclease I [Gammaproteobacteria bacterium]
MPASLYWYDYETFGIDPARDRIAQFAGIRTDMDLNIISDPLAIYCKAADDVLPHPEACLVTGITPQKTLAEGIIEPEFIAAIHHEFATANTCVAGFNNIRFDDEFTRYALYRNFYDPYAREWQNGNSRWDIIDLVRITRALRPEGIIWPMDENNNPTNRLELITRVNDIAHEAAHDALSDVYATIAVARLIREKQPRLYDYIFQHKHKNEVLKLLNLYQRSPVLHTSDMYPGSVGNTAMVLPLAQHPINKNGIIVFDLRYDPQPLIDLSIEDIRDRIYTSKDKLPEGVERIPVKTVHINKCPVVVPINTLDEASAERLNIDRNQHLHHAELLLRTHGLAEKIQQVFNDNPFDAYSDPDLNLYGGGFFSHDDRARMDDIRRTPADELSQSHFHFDDARLGELLFRYRARNYPDTLTPDEARTWQDYRRNKFSGTAEISNQSLADYMQRIDTLLQEADRSEQQKQLLRDLKNYGETIMQSLNA